MTGGKYLAAGRRVIEQESAALAELASRLDEGFVRACELLLACQGRVIITGMGKSGIVAQKIAASLTSTGVPAHFLHPAEGMHGDLGVVHRQDLVIAISNSGETSEILDVLVPVKLLGVPLIAITRHPSSSLGRQADAVLPLGDSPEADAANLIPSTSTTCTLALGDALVIALCEERGLTADDFAVLHPQGMLGRRLTLRCSDLLRGEATNPTVPETASLFEALQTITAYALGGTSVVSVDGQISGILTDGDVRRIFERSGESGARVGDVLAQDSVGSNDTRSLDSAL